MGQSLKDAMQIRRYLLGELSDGEQSQLEERLMTEKNTFQEFLKMEESLTDEYVMGELSEPERERFETYFMKAPERRESVEFASVLGQYLSQAREQAREDAKEDEWMYPAPASRRGSNTALIAVLVCVIVLLATCTAWLAIKTGGLSKEVEQARNEQSRMNQREEELQRRLAEQQASGEQLAMQLDEARARLGEKERELMELSHARNLSRSNSPANVITAVLLPGLERGDDQSQQVNVSRSAIRLQLILLLEGQTYRGYSAELKTAEGQQVFRNNHLKGRTTKRGKVVIVELPAKIITESDYVVVLSGAAESAHEKLHTYQFRVVRR